MYGEAHCNFNRMLFHHLNFDWAKSQYFIYVFVHLFCQYIYIFRQILKVAIAISRSKLLKSSIFMIWSCDYRLAVHIMAYFQWLLLLSYSKTWLTLMNLSFTNDILTWSKVLPTDIWKEVLEMKKLRITGLAIFMSLGELTMSFALVINFSTWVLQQNWWLEEVPSLWYCLLS